jgi:hypothetical protein
MEKFHVVKTVAIVMVTAMVAGVAVAAGAPIVGTGAVNSLEPDRVTDRPPEKPRSATRSGYETTGGVLLAMIAAENGHLYNNETVVMVGKHLATKTDRAGASREESEEGVEESRMPTQEQFNTAFEGLEKNFNLALCGS